MSHFDRARRRAGADLRAWTATCGRGRARETRPADVRAIALVDVRARTYVRAQAYGRTGA